MSWLLRKEKYQGNPDRITSMKSESEDFDLKKNKYIEGNLLEKNVKRPFCCTISTLQVYFTLLCCHFKE